MLSIDAIKINQDHLFKLEQINERSNCICRIPRVIIEQCFFNVEQLCLVASSLAGTCLSTTKNIIQFDFREIPKTLKTGLNNTIEGLLGVVFITLIVAFSIFYPPIIEKAKELFFGPESSKSPAFTREVGTQTEAQIRSISSLSTNT